MAHFDLHEQEQISNLKSFWQRGGKYIIGLLIVVIVAYLANVFWSLHISKEASKAAVMYTKFDDAINNNDESSTINLVTILQNDYPTIEYSSMASLEAAKLMWQNKNTAATTKLLMWVINTSKDQGLVSVARLRLADVYIDQQKFDKAMQQMLQPHDPSFDPLYYTKRGDLYVAKGNLNKARDAYKEALQKAGQDTNLAQGIQMRLDVLGNN